MIPKFRAWDKENKKMLVVNDICNLFWENTFFECYELVPDPKGKREYELINHRIDFEDCVLMCRVYAWVGKTKKNQWRIGLR